MHDIIMYRNNHNDKQHFYQLLIQGKRKVEEEKLAEVMSGKITCYTMKLIFGTTAKIYLLCLPRLSKIMLSDVM